MFRNQDADLRKVCTKILCKVQGATLGQMIQPHPSLPWPVASGRKQLIPPFLRFDHLQVSFTPPRVEYVRIQLYGMSQWLQTELVACLLNHLEHFPQSTYDTHTNTKTGTPNCLLTSNKLTIQSLAKFKWKVLSGIMIRFAQHNVHMTKHDNIWPCHLNPMSKVWSRYSCVVLEGICFEFARTVIVFLFVFAQVTVGVGRGLQGGGWLLL